MTRRSAAAINRARSCGIPIIRHTERRWRVVTVVPQEITELRTKLDILEGNAASAAIQKHQASLPANP
jgi:hypothetical protein